jgi:hypothetical protein
LWTGCEETLPFGREGRERWPGEREAAMKTTILTVWKLVVFLIAVPLLVGTTQAPTGSVAASDSALATDTETAPSSDSGPASGQDQTMLPAPVVPKLSPAAEEVVRLAQSGVSEDVMVAYVANSVSPFRLGSDQIIYLNDLGIPATVVKAMILRDTALDQMTNSSETTPGPATTYNGGAPQTDTNVPPPPDTPPSDSPTDYTDDGTGPYSTPDVPTDYFYGSLAPYGNWIVIPGYGRCWQPIACVLNRGWQPYCNQGCWIYTDCGWYWRSSYSWGWAPFHYGRWWCDEHHGWVWLPGHVWGPGWVSWRHSADYCGWAPLPPGARLVAGVGLTWRNHPVGTDFDFGLKASQYTFVPIAHLADSAPDHFRIPPQQLTKVFQQTAAINPVATENGRVINRGIEASRVAAASHHEIRRLTIRDRVMSVGAGFPPEGMGATGRSEFPGFHPRPPSQDMTHNAARPIGQPYQPTADSGLGGRDSGRPIAPVFVRPPPLQSQTFRLPQPITPSMPTPGLVRSGPDTPSAPGRREGYPPNSIILRGPQSPSAIAYQPPAQRLVVPAPTGQRPAGTQPYVLSYPTPVWQATSASHSEPNRAVQAAPEYRPTPAREYSEPVRSAPAEQVRSQPVVVEHYSAPAPAPAAPAAQSSYGAVGYGRSGH